MKKFYFYNKFHYGDCLVSLHFLIHLSRVNDIECEFMCNPHYHLQLSQLISQYPKVTLSPLPMQDFGKQDLRMKCGENRAINLWCCPSLQRMWGGEIKDWPTYSSNYPNYLDVGSIVFEIWKYICRRYDLIFPFVSKEDILFDQEILSKDMIPPMKFDSYDFLLANSYCHSNQLNMPLEHQDLLFQEIIQLLERNGKRVITTQKLANYECTSDYNLSLVGIAQLSKKCKVIFGVPTSVFWITLNKWTIQNCKKYINFTNDVVVYDFMNKTKNVRSVEELRNEIICSMEEL